MYAYRIAGLTVASEIALPGVRQAAETPSPDVVMRRGEVPMSLDNPSVSLPGWDAADDRFLLRAPGVGRFLLRGGREIAFEPEAGAQAADCAIYLLGTVFGALLHQRGQIVLHASAVVVDGKAILFCGRSGVGKSTLAAALSVRAYPVLSDDFCAIHFNADGEPHIATDSRQLKLAAEAIDALGLERRRGASVLRGTGKYYVEPRISADAADLSIGGVYVLARTHSQLPVKIEAPTTAEALRVLQRNAYRHGIVKRTGQTRLYFEAAAAIARAAGVFRLTPPRDLARLPETVALLERHWVENGLLRQAQ